MLHKNLYEAKPMKLLAPVEPANSYQRRVLKAHTTCEWYQKLAKPICIKEAVKWIAWIVHIMAFKKQKIQISMHLIA